ncbi:MAG: type II secretion system protein N, partial [Steroidobacteraceae bacterium]
HAGMIATGVAAFVLVLVVQFPARWAALALPRGVACGQVAGTLWSGTCAGLAAAGMPLGDLGWSLHPLRLLTGRLDLDVALTRGAGAARARVELSPTGAIAARGIHADFPLDHAFIPQLPPSTRGSAAVELSSLDWNGKRITEIHGQIEVQGLTIGGGELLGSYRLLFPGSPGSELVGHLSDLGGPFAVAGTVRLTAEPGYEVDSLIAARPSASPDLLSQLRYLGAPDAQGRRQFSIAGTF